MNKNQKIAGSAGLVGFLAATTVVRFHQYNQDLYGRFPDLDRKIVRKAYRKMMLRALRGTYTDEQLETDESSDLVFLGVYHEIAPRH